MDVNKFLERLNSAELEIEYYLRGLSSQQRDAKSFLIKAILAENDDKTKMPRFSHISPNSDPTVEIETCRMKSDECNAVLDQLETEPPIEQVYSNLSRTKHYRDRADRIVNTFTSIRDVADITNIASSLRRVTNRYIKILNDYSKKQEVTAMNTETNFGSSACALSTENTGSNTAESEPQTSSEQSVTSIKEVIAPQPGNLNLGNTSISTSGSRQSSGTTPKIPNQNQAHANNNTDVLRDLDPKIIQAIAEVFAKMQINQPINKPPVNEPVLEIPFLPLPNQRQNDNQNQRRDENLGNQQYPQFQVVQRDFTHQLRQRWNLSFDGESGDVKDFVYRLEVMARDDRIPDETLARCLHMFLSGKASDWYWVYKQNTPNAVWPRMRDAIVSYFSSYESEDETREMIIRRYQGPKETFSDFALEIQKLNGRLRRRLTEQELIIRLCQNMNPALRNVTLAYQVNIQRIEELRVICQRFEKMWSQTGYDPRGFSDASWRRRPTVNELEYPAEKTYSLPENSSDVQFYQEAVRPSSTGNYENSPTNDPRLDVSALNAPQRRDFGPERRNYVICWNCKDIGHIYIDCTQDLLHKFCFGCGRENVRKPDCYNCQKKMSENWKPNVQYPRESRSDPNMSKSPQVTLRRPPTSNVPPSS